MSSKNKMHHRSYQPYTPVNNLILKQRWDQDVYQIHRKKVHAAKAVIDNHPPMMYMHLNIKLKKLQTEATRLAIVERDNRLLLDKMEHIFFNGATVDCHNVYESKSLNNAKRQRELVRVAHENMAILRRLQAKQPTYSHKRWIFERKVNEQYLRNIARYPSYFSEYMSVDPSRMTSQRSTENLSTRSKKMPPIVTPQNSEPGSEPEYDSDSDLE